MSRFTFALILAFSLPLAALAQGTGIALGGFGYDAALPVEITADSLDVNQADGTATFAGNVLIGQGDMRLSAESVIVEYGESEDGKTQITRLLASGGVTLVSADEAAEADEAVYDVVQGVVSLTGNVLVTQGPAAISGDQLVVNLETGSGSIEGNVRTVLNSGSDQ